MCLLTDRIDREVLDAAGPSLKIVANVAVGYNNIDVAACRARGIIVDQHARRADQCLRRLHVGADPRRSRGGSAKASAWLRRGDWKGWALDHMLGMELRGKQLGIVGLGRIGRAVAEKAPAFGMRVAYTDAAAARSARRRAHAARSPAGDVRRRVAALPADAQRRGT